MTAEQLGTETNNRRNWFNENDDRIRAMTKVKNKLHDIYLICPTTRNKTVFTDLSREVQRELRGITNDWWQDMQMRCKATFIWEMSTTLTTL